MGTLRLAAGDVTAEVNAAAGGRVSSFRVRGHDLLGRAGPQPYAWGSFVMAPYAGRVRNGRLTWAGRVHQLPVNDPPHALHGLVLDRPWQVDGYTDHGVRLSCALDDRWPWPGHVEQRIELHPDGLECAVEVHTEADEMPAWCGWHPWFRRTLDHGDPVRIELDAEGMRRRDSTGIATSQIVPVPEPPWDDCFVGVRWPVRLSWPRELVLEVSADTSTAVLFTERPTMVCVEPQTGPPDAVALDDFALVTPADPLTARMRWTVTPE